MRLLFKSQADPAPWPRMILCALAATVPLLFGLANGQIAPAIYGSLAGYLLALNDHLGTLTHRLWVITLTFFLLLAGFALGFVLRENVIVFQLSLIILIYWIGILGGDGAELERGVLFLVLSLIIMFFSKNISFANVPAIFLYVALSYMLVIVGIPLISRLHKHQPVIFSGLRQSFQKSLTRERGKHIHAASYTATGIFSIWFAQWLHIERGYWVTITVLLVMRADRSQSLFKTFQRLIGTALGVLFCDIIIQLTYEPKFLILFVCISTFWIPFFILRNYLYASLFITIFVVFLLEMAAFKHGDTLTPFTRLQATVIGCVLSLMGSLFAKLLSSRPLRSG